MFLYPGTYKNFDELEEYLTRDELLKMYQKAYEVKKEDKRFAAALKGIDIDENSTSEFDEIKQRAEAKAHGLTEEQYEIGEFFNIIYDDGDDIE